MALDESRYLVESYRPGPTAEPLGPPAAMIDSSDGRVELLLTIHIPADEVLFSLFAASSATSVERACRRADFAFTRITEAIASAPPLTS